MLRATHRKGSSVVNALSRNIALYSTSRKSAPQQQMRETMSCIVSAPIKRFLFQSTQILRAPYREIDNGTSIDTQEGAHKAIEQENVLKVFKSVVEADRDFAQVSCVAAAPALEAMIAELEATILECTAMKEELVLLKSELGAMRVVRLRGTCPQGFSARYYSRLVEDFNRSPQLFDEDVLDIEKLIAVQCQNINTSEEKINDMIFRMKNINRLSMQSSATLQDAFLTLRSGRKSRHSEAPELSGVKWYNETTIKTGVTTGVKALMAGFGVDKSANPLMCVLGAAGQGKTDTLKHIRRDNGMQKEIMNTINEHENWTKSRGDVKCKYIVPLFATFHQDRTFVAAFEPNVLSALCNRLLSDYLGLTFDVKNSSLLKRISVHELTEFIREREAVERGCTRDEICIVILIDEVRRVFDSVGDSNGADNVSVLLDEVCSVQQHALTNKSLTFAVVTLLDVTTLHDRVRKGSQRPLHSIPLRPCSSEDIDDFAVRCIESAKEAGTFSPTKDWKIHFNKDDTVLAGNAPTRHLLLVAAHATGGHFRSLKGLRGYFLENGIPPPRTDSQPCTAAYILDIMARQLHNPLFQMKETDQIGAAFLKSGKSEMTLYDVAMSNQHGVFYQDMNARTGEVSPCVAPLALSQLDPFPSDKRVAWVAVKLFHFAEAMQLLWDHALQMTMVEALAATLIGVVNGGEPVTLEDVFRSAFVQHWDDKINVTLCYRASCGQDLFNVVMNNGEYPTSLSTDAVSRARKSAEAKLLRAREQPGNIVHTLLEEVSASGERRTVPVFMQFLSNEMMDATDNMKDFAKRLHDFAQNAMKLEQGEYYVVQYLSNSLTSVQCWEWCIPKGTIIIERSSLQMLLKPLGMHPLLTMMDTIPLHFEL